MHMSQERSTPAGHIVPVKVLLGVWFALLVLTGLTVAAASMDLGSLNIWVAMTIATVKATLVGLYFMHLRYDRPFNAIVLVCSLMFVMLFVGLALMDTVQYQPLIEEWQIEHPAAAE
jgi:cytochrome c oxidase subunit 4